MGDMHTFELPTTSYDLSIDTYILPYYTYASHYMGTLKNPTRFYSGMYLVINPMRSGGVGWCGVGSGGGG